MSLIILKMSVLIAQGHWGVTWVEEPETEDQKVNKTAGCACVITVISDEKAIKLADGLHSKQLIYGRLDKWPKV